MCFLLWGIFLRESQSFPSWISRVLVRLKECAKTCNCLLYHTCRSRVSICMEIASSSENIDRVSRLFGSCWPWSTCKGHISGSGFQGCSSQLTRLTLHCLMMKISRIWMFWVLLVFIFSLFVSQLWRVYCVSCWLKTNHC